MKKIFLLFIALVLNCNAVFASENFLNEDWWRTATVEDVKAEIDAGADVNVKNEYGETVLMNKTSVEIAELLIKSGADVNLQDKKGKTALFYQYKPEIVQMLINAGADVNVKDEDEQTALFSSQNRSPHL